MSEGFSREESREKAERIFEALSGVDGELLERSEKRTSRKVTVLRRYSGLAAACLCLIAVGAAAWTGTLRVEQENTSLPARSGIPLSVGPATDQAAAICEDAEEEEMVRREVTAGLPEETAAAGGAKEAEKAVTDGGDLLSGMEALTLEAARATELLGGYVPEELPEGYQFEGAWLQRDETFGRAVSLSVSFCKGMDDIFLRIMRAEEDDGEIFYADLSVPGTYDVNLYEIPYAETVPEEYQDVFYHPVFLAKDLTQELIEARMKRMDDAGDTDTPRGNFGVLYVDDGVLVEFSGDLPAEQVWKLFCQME